VTWYLVRHAKAGSRGKWMGHDVDRPLTESGWAQAAALADRLQKVEPPRLLSSPYVRCMQTLEPLAERIGVPVEPELILAEGEDSDALVMLLDGLPDGTVLCSHGDVIPDTIDALIRRGMTVESPPDWRKASLWVIERDGAGEWRGRAEPPPA
jgi:8-oxo-dGTP diphosphatase